MSKTFCDLHGQFFDVDQSCTYCDGMVIDAARAFANKLRYVSIKDLDEVDESTAGDANEIEVDEPMPEDYVDEGLFDEADLDDFDFESVVLGDG